MLEAELLIIVCSDEFILALQSNTVFVICQFAERKGFVDLMGDIQPGPNSAYYLCISPLIQEV